MPRYKFIINPVPLNKKKKRFLIMLKSFMEEKRIDFSYEYTSKDKGAESIARKSIKHGYEIIVACGGDGTIREILNGIYGTNAVLGILPLGTSNDFAKQIGLKNLKKAKVVLFNGRKRKIDIALAEFISKTGNKRIYFCSTSGVGFDANILKLNERRWFLNLKKLIGNIIYPLAGLLLVFSYKPNNVELEFHGKRINLKLLMLNVNFVKSMAGMKVTKNANLNNGVLDIFIVGDLPLYKKLASFLWYGITSKKLPFKEIDYISKDNLGYNKYNLYNIKSFTISSQTKISVQLNGDVVGNTPVRFSIIQNALELLY